VLDLLLAELARRPHRQVVASDRPEAAVALLLAPDPDRLLVIRRAEREGDPWSGHLAFPGGRRQAGDVDLLATAIRETAEETGIHLERSWCRTQLDDLLPQTPTLPPILVRPFVLLLPEAVAPGVSNEVTDSSWLPLARLAADGVYGARSIEIRGEPRVVQGYQLAEGFLWGMSAQIVAPVLLLWKEFAESGRPGGGSG
jgi:8-oxo-dGTP pyrophosphatase MutT (NUDIX family)